MSTDSTLVQAYTKFLGQLAHSRCNVRHYITYRRDKIAGMQFDDVLKLPVFLPSSVHVYKTVISSDADKYTAYKNNVHHWTTRYVWESFIPMLMKDLSIDLNSQMFVKIPYLWSTCDFSYHNLIDAKFKIYDFSMKYEDIGDHEVLRNTNNCPHMVLSCYHSLFRLSHKSGLITNLNDAPVGRIAVNCDSMAIPVIPVLACFAKQVLVVDNRTGKNLNYMKMISDFHPQHYIALFTEENFLFNQKHTSQLL